MFDEEYFDETLKRIQFEFEDNQVDVDCLKNLEFNRLDGKRVSFRKGMKVKLPYWLALMLEKERYIKIHFSEKIDYPSIYKIALSEVEQRSLQKINKYFYILVRKKLNEFKTQATSMTLGDLRKMEIEIRKLMTSRLSKILKIAEKEKNITNMVRNMTPEEEWLYKLVSDAVKSWKDVWKSEEEKEK